MAASTQPLDGNPSTQESWQTLVGDHRYRLFAAGNRRAAIAECLPAHSRLANLENLPPGPHSFDARYGLGPEAQKRMVLLTEVARVPDVSKGNLRVPGRTAAERRWRWEATHRVEPISKLKSYIDEQSGSCIFFLTRSTQPIGGTAPKTRERLADSAMRIGKSLGLDAKNLEALRVAGMVHELGKNSHAHPDGEKYYVTADDDREDGERCRHPECANAASTRLLAEPLCAAHFINSCYERLDSCADKLSRRPVTEEESESLCVFLRDCIEQTRLLTQDPFHQESLERARLLDIMHTATELSRHLRRSPRLSEAIPLRLMCETPGRPWEESVSTKLISQHGAMLECIHQVRPEDWLFVERLDTHSRARARMAWRGSASRGHFAVAVEFVDADNFWQLSWPGNHAGSAASPYHRPATA